MAEVLFKDKSPLGEYVKVGQLMFKVIGVNSKKEQWGGPVCLYPVFHITSHIQSR